MYAEATKFHLIDNARMLTFRNDKIRVAMDGDDHLYIATYGAGLYIYHLRTGQMQHFISSDVNPLFCSDFLTAVTIDHLGNIWLGSDNAGVFCLSALPSMDVDYLFPQPTLRFGGYNQVRALGYVDGKGLFVGSTLGMLYEANPFTGKFEERGSYPSTVLGYMEDSKQRKWVATRGAGVFVDGVQYCQKDKKRHLPCDNIYDLQEDGHGRVWLASFEGGLLMAEAIPRGTTFRFKQFLTASLGEKRVQDIMMGEDQVLWIATRNGLYSVDTRLKRIEESSFRKYNVENHQLPNNEVSSVYVAKDGTLWVGIVGYGLLHLKKEGDVLSILAQYNAQHGFKMPVVTSIMEDLQGNIWVGTERGLILVSVKNRLTRKFMFGSTFMGNAFTDNCTVLLPDGSLMFGTCDGILHITENGDHFPNMRSRLVFTDLLVNGQSIYNLSQEEAVTDASLTRTKNVDLPHNQNSITINFSDLDYSVSPSHLYQYYLEGYDKDWHPSSNQNMATYNNLPPGKYVFHVRQIGNSEEQSLGIVIHRPWYNSWWAWAIYLIVTVAAGYYAFRSQQERSRLKQRIRMEKEMADFRDNLFTHVIHELRTPISIIHTAIGKLRENKKHEQPMSKTALQTAERGAQRISKLAAQLMEYRKVNTDSMKLQVRRADVIACIREVYRDFWVVGSQRKMSMTFTPFAASFKMLFDAKVVESIVYNLLSNAVKYAPYGGKVAVEVSREQGKLMISVVDSGPGISEVQREHLFQPFMHGYVTQGGVGIGLYVAHAMARLHHGSLEYKPQVGQGARFVATIPMEEAEYAESERIQHVVPEMQESQVEKTSSEIVLEMVPEAINNLTIAIVEDDVDMMEQIKRELCAYFHVEGYMDGKSAIEGILASKPALVICDVMLPEVDGFEVVRRLKQQMPHLPVIMLTVLDDNRHLEKGYMMGADYYMTKPCNYRFLVARMVHLIKQSQQIQSPSQTKETPSTVMAEQAQILSNVYDKKFLSNLDSLIFSHLSDFNFSMDSLANSLHMGRTKFYSKVKELTGMSPNKYMLKCRMEEAAKLLTESECTVSEISYKVGIQEASYFYKCFKNYYGMSPSEYKKSRLG